MKRFANTHPGAVLVAEFLLPLGIGRDASARAADVPPRRNNDIALGGRSITADTAVRFAEALGAAERFWPEPQVDFDLDEAGMATVADDVVRKIKRIAAS